MVASTCFQTVEQSEVVKKVVLPEVSKLNDSIMNKNHRDKTKFSLEKKDPRKRKMGLLLFVYSLSAIAQTNKQTNKQTI